MGHFAAFSSCCRGDGQHFFCCFCTFTTADDDDNNIIVIEDHVARRCRARQPHVRTGHTAKSRRNSRCARRRSRSRGVGKRERERDQGWLRVVGFCRPRLLVNVNVNVTGGGASPHRVRVRVRDVERSNDAFFFTSQDYHYDGHSIIGQ